MQLKQQILLLATSASCPVRELAIRELADPRVVQLPFQWGSVPLRSDIKGTELLPVNVLILLER